MEKNEQIKRIEKYEVIMQEIHEILEDYSEDKFDVLHEKLSELAAYYGSDVWKEDFAADEKGLLPKDLKRGVLSEDGVYNLLEKYREMNLEEKKERPTTQIGVPKYKRGDCVLFNFPRMDTVEQHVGIITVVDAYGTMEQNEEPSYDIRISEDQALYKHVRESWIVRKEEK